MTKPYDTTLIIAAAWAMASLPGCASGADSPADAEVIRLPSPDSSEPFWLSQTGLYRDIATRALAPGVVTYEPSYALWSDGADKRRFMRLPASSEIDTSDMDHWVFPVGTMFWKEFALQGEPLETRWIVRVGDGPRDYFMGAFVWNDARSDAHYVPDGSPNVLGTEHDVPSTKACGNCHNGEPGRILGVSALQTAALAPELAYRVPGDDITAPALGYLHANCGHCHNPNGVAWPDTSMDLRLHVSERSLQDSTIYRTSVGVVMSDTKLRKQRIVPGDPAASGIYHRMSVRGPKIQMPPIATEHVDDRGLAAVEAFIRAL